MAITIDDKPRDLAILNEKLIYVASSGNVANTGFRFQFEVTIGGDTLVFLVPPNPANKGVFDVREAIRGYFTPLLAAQATGQESIHDVGVSDSVLHKYEDAASSSTWIRNVSVTIKEGWIISGVFTPTTSGQASDSFVCWPARPDQAVGPFPVYRHDYIDLIDSKFMTDMSSQMYTSRWPDRFKYGFDPSSAFIIPVRNWSTGILTLFADNGTFVGVAPAKIRGVIKDAGGTDHTFDYTITTSGTGRLMHFGAYPYNLDSTNYVGFVKPSSYPGFKYYSLQILDSANAPISAEYVFFPEPEYGTTDILNCSTNDYIVRATWLNSHGTWDYFNFTMQYQERIEFNRRRTRRPLGTYGAATFDFNQYDRGIEELDAEAQWLVTASSDWISQNEFDFLANMFRSKYVYIQAPYVVQRTNGLNSFGNRLILPVVIDASDYTFQKTNFTQTKKIEVTFRSAVPIW